MRSLNERIAGSEGSLRLTSHARKGVSQPRLLTESESDCTSTTIFHTLPDWSFKRAAFLQLGIALLLQCQMTFQTIDKLRLVMPFNPSNFPSPPHGTK
jgi:hypothetical protein